MTKVLVTDGEERASLGIVRSLGRAGHAVFVCSTRRRSLAGASRHARAQASVSSPLDDSQTFVDDVERLVRSWDIDVLVPVTDASLLALLPEQSRLEPVRIPFPPAAVHQAACDKAHVLEVARGLGIATPRQTVLSHAGEDPERTASALTFPLVLKPARSVVRADRGLAKVGVSYASDPAALRAQLARYAPGAFPILLQERATGPGIGVFLLLWHGELKAHFAHRRLREKPPSGGVSVYRTSIDAGPELVRRSADLLRALGWEGVAMVEYKLDSGGTPVLMEVNGRFWGSLQLAVDAGVDYPRLLVDCALGRDPAPITKYRVGVRNRWELGEVDHLLARIRRRAAESATLNDGGRLAAVSDFVRALGPGSRGEVLRLSDPWPMAVELANWIRRS